MAHADVVGNTVIAELTTASKGEFRMATSQPLVQQAGYAVVQVQCMEYEYIREVWCRHDCIGDVWCQDDTWRLDAHIDPCILTLLLL